MRDIRTESLYERQKLPLAAQGRFERTFFGLGLFTATNLFLCGTYLLCGAMVDPLGATNMAVVVAGFALALAAFLVVFLVWSRSKELLARKREAYREAVYSGGPVLTVRGQTVQDGSEAKPAPTEPKALPGSIGQACAARAGK
jgi:hypothetical protein